MQKMNKRQVVRAAVALWVIIVFLGAVCGTAQAAEQKPIVLKAVAYGGPKYAQRVIFERAMKTIEEKSNKGITFQYFPGTQLLKATETFEALRKNVIQIGITGAEYEMDRMGIIGASNTLPFSWDPKKFLAHWRDPGMYYDLAEPIWNKNNMHTLANPRVLCDLHSRKPVRKLEDFKGKLIRASGSIAAAVKLLGAEPSFIALDEIYEAIERGVIDGACTSLSDYMATKRYEVARYLTIAGLYSGSMNHCMNLEVYKSLPAEWRKIIDDAFQEAEQWWATVGLENDNKQMFDTLKKNKVEIYYLPDEELARWKKAITPFWDEMAKKYPNDFPRLKPIIDKLSR